MKDNRRRCKNCDNIIDHKHINAKFCGQKCKDKYHNRTGNVYKGFINVTTCCN